MQGGFSFCGTDIADLGLEYVPENTDTYVFAGSDYKLHEQVFEGHHGGYFYGTTVSPKVFTLRCIFQESHINDGILTRVERFFRRGKSGRLVFKKRPWVYYVATVTDINVNAITNYLNGVVGIQMTAYYPFGRCDQLFYPDGFEYERNMVANSAMFPESMALSTSAVPDGTELTSQKEIYLHNGGTESAAVAIEIAGDVGDGVIITNATTGKKCSFVGLSKSISSDVGRYVVCDGINGCTIQTDGSKSVDASLYHDYGFLELAPTEILLQDHECSVRTDGTLATESGRAWSTEYAGANLFAQGHWRTILGWTDDSRMQMVLDQPLSGPATVSPIIAAMNRIIITPVSTMAQTKLNFVYKPTFA